MSPDTMDIMKKRFIYIILPYFLLYFSFLFFLGNREITIIYGAMAFSLIGILFLTGCAYYIYRCSSKDEKPFWMWIIWAFLFFFMGELIRLYYIEVYHTKVPLESFASLAYLLNGTLLSIAVIRLVFPKIDKSVEVRALLDVSIISISILTVGWGFIIYPAVRMENGSSLLTLFSIWYPMTDIGIIIALLFLMMFSETILFTKKWLTLGLLGFVALDVLNMMELSMDVSGLVGVLDPFWYMCFAAIVYAGLNRKTAKKEVHNRPYGDLNRQKQRLFIVFPYLTLSVLIVVVIVDHGQPDAFIQGAAVCNFLIIIKQLAILAENKLKQTQLLNLNHSIMTSLLTLETEREQLTRDNLINVKDSLTDHLTGAYNRRYLENIFEELKALVVKQTAMFSVIMMDIDNFKDINDKFGHLAGDEVLKHVCAIMKEFVRGSEAVIRYGGDEFVMILPEVSAYNAQSIAERIRHRVENRGATLIENNERCTISVGISEWDKSDFEPWDVITKADCALYAAKLKGRNRCEMYMPEMTKVCS